MGVESSPERISQGIFQLGRHTAEGFGIGGFVVADPHNFLLEVFAVLVVLSGILILIFFTFFRKKKSGELFHQGFCGVGTDSSLGSRPTANFLEYRDQLFDGVIHRLGDLDLNLTHILAGLELVPGEHGHELAIESLCVFQKMEVFSADLEIVAAVVLDRFDVIFYLREANGSGEHIGRRVDQLVGFIDDAEVARQ